MLIKVPITRRASYCGEAVVESEHCFVPGLKGSNIKVCIDVDKCDLNVELVCFNSVVVSGILKKTIKWENGPRDQADVASHGASVDAAVGKPGHGEPGGGFGDNDCDIEREVAFQAVIPLRNGIFTRPLCSKDFEVTGVQVCDGYFKLLCPVAENDGPSHREAQVTAET